MIVSALDERSSCSLNTGFRFVPRNSDSFGAGLEDAGAPLLVLLPLLLRFLRLDHTLLRPLLLLLLSLFLFLIMFFLLPCLLLFLFCICFCFRFPPYALGLLSDGFVICGCVVWPRSTLSPLSLRFVCRVSLHT